LFRLNPANPYGGAIGQFFFWGSEIIRFASRKNAGQAVRIDSESLQRGSSFVKFVLTLADFLEKVALMGGRVGVWPSPTINYI
jgi:hypothetical protein